MHLILAKTNKDVLMTKFGFNPKLQFRDLGRIT
jgi:hypothetical protein